MKKIQVSIYKVKYDGTQKYVACENSIPDGRFWKGKKCSNYIAIAESSVAAVCASCVNKVVEPPILKSVQEKSDKPRGWKFMKVYVHLDGTVYHKGVDQPSLKGTLPATAVSKNDSKQKMTKQEKLERLSFVGRQIQHLKAELFSETRKGKKLEITKQLSKLNRELTKLSK